MSIGKTNRKEWWRGIFRNVFFCFSYNRFLKKYRPHTVIGFRWCYLPPGLACYTPKMVIGSNPGQTHTIMGN